MQKQQVGLTVVLGIYLWDSWCFHLASQSTVVRLQLKDVSLLRLNSVKSWADVDTGLCWCEGLLFTVISLSYRYCDDSHLWYEKHTSEVCRRVRRLSFSRSKWTVEWRYDRSTAAEAMNDSEKHCQRKSSSPARLCFTPELYWDFTDRWASSEPRASGLRDRPLEKLTSPKHCITAAQTSSQILCLFAVQFSVYGQDKTKHSKLHGSGTLCPNIKCFRNGVRFWLYWICIQTKI